ncbi:hypothetical protein MNB_ARC-1_397 [hydrothermal vent metagenome]|uniref:Uncharacterized protein n=1 Tax=hydrothermal vent metagenome TaxID=652676 RepID=A0A3B1E668_9ZZZZ
MTLVHTALLSEGQSIIEYFKLNLIGKNPTLYSNNKVLLLVGGIGIKRTKKTLEYVFDNHIQITKAINIGIAGCSDVNIKIGQLFITNKILKNINHMKLHTVKKAKTGYSNYKALYDMEGSVFNITALQYLEKENIYIFKIVSDYLNSTIPKKEVIKQLIKSNLQSIVKWI